MVRWSQWGLFILLKNYKIRDQREHDVYIGISCDVLLSLTSISSHKLRNAQTLTHWIHLIDIKSKKLNNSLITNLVINNTSTNHF